MNGTCPLEIVSDLGRRHPDERPATAVTGHHVPMGPTWMGPTCTT
ncbi:hypothetical protein [Streptomyces sp. NPDC093099]